MLEQFSDLKRTEAIKSKINRSLINDALKKKALLAFETAQINAISVLEFLKIDAESKPKNKPKQSGQGLKKKAQELIQDIAIKTRNENPVRLDIHAQQLELLSELVKDLVLIKACDKDLQNDLTKYKFFGPFGEARENKERRKDFTKTIYDKAVGMSSRTPEDLKKHLEAIAFNYQIVAISGLVLSK